MQLYKQTTSYTCASASVLMIINHFKPEVKLSRENEFDIWRSSVCLPTRGSSLYGLALYANNLGIPVRIIVGQHHYKFPNYRFKAYTKKEIDVAEEVSDMLYKKALSKGIKIEERDFEIDEIRKPLQEGRVILLRINRAVIKEKGRAESNYIPFYKYKDRKFYGIDPSFGPVILSEQKIKENLESIKIKCKRDNRITIFG
jgi:hypothetical protein